MILSIKRLLFGFFRYIVTTLSFVQRFPFLIIYFFGFSICWLIYKLTGFHRLLIFFSKLCLSIFFFFNGIWLERDKNLLAKLQKSVIFGNYYGPIDNVIMFLILPYRKLVFLDEEFFKKNILKGFFYLLGFYPKETDFDIHNYQRKKFRAEPYLKAGFSLVECVHITRQAVEAVPYTIMLALKLKLPIHFFRISGSENAKFATFFTPKKITITPVDTIEVGRRPEIAILYYRKLLSAYRKFEKERDLPIKNKS